MQIERQRFALGLICAAALAAQGKEYAVFDVIGDSISAGNNPEQPGLGWVQMLEGADATTNTLESLWPGIEINNSASSGSTAEEWAADFGGRLSAVKERNPDLVVIFIGGNDLTTYIEGNRLETAEAEEYRTHLTSIVTHLQNNTPTPELVLIQYYDLFDGFSKNLTGEQQGKTNATEAVTILNQIIQEVAASNECHWVDSVHENFLHHGYGAELGDTNHLVPDYLNIPLANFDVHPITAGHRKIHELIFKKLDYLKRYDVPEAWMAEFGLSNFEEDAPLDPDTDGLLTWQEYITDSVPTNSASPANNASSISTDAGTPQLSFSTSTNCLYSLDWSSNLVSNVWNSLTNDIPGTGSELSVSDPNSAPGRFYRLKIQRK